MKKIYSLILPALGAMVCTAVLANPDSPDRVQSISGRGTSDVTVATQPPERRRMPAKKLSEATEGSLYISTATSFFDNTGNFDYNAPVERKFATRIRIEGDKAYVTGFVDYHIGEVDYEYPVEGVYDNIRHTVTIPNAGDKSIHLADVWDEASGKTMNLYLVAGSVNANGGISYKNDLVIRLSDDETSGTFMTSYGIFDMGSQLYYDYYKTIEFAAPADRPEIIFESSDISFSNYFVSVGKQMSGEISLMNLGGAEGEFTLTSTSPELVIEETSGSIAAGEKRRVAFTFTPTEVGDFNSTVILTDASGENLGEISVSAFVNTPPDYAPVVKDGSAPISFDIDDTFPFTIGEYDGHTAAVSSNNGHNGSTSAMTCLVNIPAGKTGVMSWDAAMCVQRPNLFYILVDGESYMLGNNQPSPDPLDMSGAVALTSGDHTITFMLYLTSDWTDFGIDSYVYVWDPTYMYGILISTLLTPPPTAPFL